ncbi:MAG: type VI secretion system baseplate subunit TssE [Candidatus Aminicenantaceae bacterium]
MGYFTTEISEPSDVDDSYFKELSEEKKLRQSIIENLTMILQTRRGSVLHLSDFGIPDIVQVYIDSGYSFEQLKKYISETILKYEPRVAKVKVEEPKFDKDNFHIFLKIKAIIKDLAGTEILLTEFSTTGWTKVVSERDV